MKTEEDVRRAAAPGDASNARPSGGPAAAEKAAGELPKTNARRLPMVGWYDPRQLLKTGVEVTISTVFGCHSNEAFSSIPVEDWKNFLRLHIDRDGTLTIYPVGLRSVPRRWKDSGQPSGPEIVPEGESTAPKLIEPPVVLERAKTETGVTAGDSRGYMTASGQFPRGESRGDNRAPPPSIRGNRAAVAAGENACGRRRYVIESTTARRSLRSFSCPSSRGGILIVKPDCRREALSGFARKARRRPPS